MLLFALTRLPVRSLTHVCNRLFLFLFTSGSLCTLVPHKSVANTVIGTPVSKYPGRFYPDDLPMGGGGVKQDKSPDKMPDWWFLTTFGSTCVVMASFCSSSRLTPPSQFYPGVFLGKKYKAKSIIIAVCHDFGTLCLQKLLLFWAA